MADVVVLPVDHRPVLVVDDDAAQRQELSEFLDRMRVHHCVAGNGRRAVDLVRRHRPKVVLLDIRMPLMDGIEAFRKIVAGPVRPRIILMSGYIECVREANALEVEPYTVLEKPIPLRTLGDFLRRVLEGEDALSTPLRTSARHI